MSVGEFRRTYALIKNNKTPIITKHKETNPQTDKCHRICNQITGKRHWFATNELTDPIPNTLLWLKTKVVYYINNLIIWWPNNVIEYRRFKLHFGLILNRHRNTFLNINNK